jgi:hypothetical protein
MRKQTKRTVAMILGAAAAAAFVLMSLDVVPQTPGMAIAIVCAMASGLFWALPARDV